MTHRRIATFLALCLWIHGFAASASATFDFVFTAQCDDCAFSGNPSDPGFDPLGDGLFESVSGTLRLSDVTLDANGFIQVDSNNFDSFTYNGSSLINPFTFDEAFTIRGLLSPSGQVQASEALRLETSDGSGGVFDFPNFCTALGQQLFRDCFGVGLVNIDVASDGTWSIFGTQAFDEGVGGQLAAVPEPGSLVWIGAGLVSFGLARRRARL